MTDLIREFAGAFMVICFTFCYVPQIVKIFKNKSSHDVSLMLIVMSIGGYLSGIVYMILTQFGLWWFLNYSIGLVMCTILVWAWYKFK